MRHTYCALYGNIGTVVCDNQFACGIGLPLDRLNTTFEQGRLNIICRYYDGASLQIS